MRPVLFSDIISQLREAGSAVFFDERTDLVRINDELVVSIVLCRHFTTARGSSRWLIRLDAGLRPDLTVAARLRPGNEAIQDYYLFPSIDLTLTQISRRLADENRIELDAYRMDDLSSFYRMAERVQIHDPL
jgi:hypothetical protein